MSSKDDKEIKDLDSQFHLKLSLNENREKYYEKDVGAECFSTAVVNQEIRDTIKNIETKTAQKIGMRIIVLDSSRITRDVAKLARLLELLRLVLTLSADIAKTYRNWFHVIN